MLISRPDALPEEKLAFVLAYCDCERDLADACAQCGIELERGREFLADVKVSRNILFEMNMRQTQGVCEENILRQVARMTFFDPRKLFDKNNELVPLHDLPDEIAAAITGVTVKNRKVKDGDDWVNETTYDYKFCDRNSSVEKLMRFAGMFELDNKQKGDAVTEMLKQVYANSSSLPLIEHKPRSIVGEEVQDIQDIDPEEQTVQASLPETFVNPFQPNAR